MQKFLVDISTFQSDIDYAALAKAVDGVIIRAGYRGYGQAGTMEEDARLKEHAEGCIKAGIPISFYWFAQEKNKTEGTAAAKFFYNLIKKYKVSFPVYYDSELSSEEHGNGRADKISKASRTDATIAFCEQMIKFGYKAGVYASESWFESKLDFDKIKKYSIWVSAYRANDGKPGRKPSTPVYDMWQYSSKGRVAGYSRNIDVNYLYKDFSEKTEKSTTEKPKTTTKPKLKTTAEIVKEVRAGKWGDDKERKRRLKAAGYDPAVIQAAVNAAIEADKKKAASKTRYTSYTVRRGDTLLAIAARFHTNYRQIAVDNGIANPNKIYVGQTLKIRK